ncbi:MAG: hypothetical protein KDI46_02600 [Alphaproteobacteria bacterium]|nr:hypothetical protein [Alphaproteobacteria bacterium]
MTLEMETIVAVSLMMAVFSAVAAVGTSIVLGAGFERLRMGFEVVRKQTGFFSDAIQKLEQKVEVVDEQTGKFSDAITSLEAKVTGVGEQANIFADSMTKMEKKIDVVDKQTGFFSDAIHKLEKQVEQVSEHEEIVAEKMEKAAGTDLISTGKAEALVAHAEELLGQVSILATRMEAKDKAEKVQVSGLHSNNMFSFACLSPQEEGHRPTIN